jgi:choline kinase
VKAIILSAGQGRRLLPFTESLPKCLLPVDGERPALEIQLRALVDCGVTEARVAVGFHAEKVEAFLETNPVPAIHVETLYNPFFDSSDNLVSAWLSSPEMRGDFLLMNGDTLFEAAVLQRLLSAPMAPVTLVINEKDEYDDDDMKVSMSAEGRLRAVSKKLAGDVVNGESIGLMRFTGHGVNAFKAALDRNVRTRRGIKAFYLSVIDELTREIPVETVSMTGLWWHEMDSPEDLVSVRADLANAPKDDRVVGLADSAVRSSLGGPSSRKKRNWAKRLLR